MNKAKNRVEADQLQEDEILAQVLLPVKVSYVTQEEYNQETLIPWSNYNYGKDNVDITFEKFGLYASQIINLATNGAIQFLGGLERVYEEDIEDGLPIVRITGNENGISKIVSDTIRAILKTAVVRMITALATGNRPLDETLQQITISSGNSSNTFSEFRYTNLWEMIPLDAQALIRSVNLKRLIADNTYQLYISPELYATKQELTDGLVIPKYAQERDKTISSTDENRNVLATMKDIDDVIVGNIGLPTDRVSVVNPENETVSGVNVDNQAQVNVDNVNATRNVIATTQGLINQIIGDSAMNRNYVSGTTTITTEDIQADFDNNTIYERPGITRVEPKLATFEKDIDGNYTGIINIVDDCSAVIEITGVVNQGTAPSTPFNTYLRVRKMVGTTPNPATDPLYPNDTAGEKSAELDFSAVAPNFQAIRKTSFDIEKIEGEDLKLYVTFQTDETGYEYTNNSYIAINLTTGGAGGGGASLSSALIDDSDTILTDGINPKLSQVFKNRDRLEERNNVFNDDDFVGLEPAIDFDQPTGKTRLKNIIEPTVDTDAATKKYVDDNAGGGLELIYNDKVSNTNEIKPLPVWDEKYLYFLTTNGTVGLLVDDTGTFKKVAAHKYNADPTMEDAVINGLQTICTFSPSSSTSGLLRINTTTPGVQTFQTPTYISTSAVETAGAPTNWKALSNPGYDTVLQIFRINKWDETAKLIRRI